MDDIPDNNTTPSPDAPDRLTTIVPAADAKTPVLLANSGECRLPNGERKKKNNTKAPASDAIFIGFDTEWCADPRRKLKNRILAYGLVVVRGNRISKLVVEPAGPDARHRLSLRRLLGLAIQRAIREKVLDGWPESACLAMHYGRGDLAACSDFRLLKSELNAVKGVLATGSAPLDLYFEIDNKTGLPAENLPFVPRKLQFSAIDPSGNVHRVALRVLDTFCLAPEGASLDALGKLLGYAKLDLPEGYDISDMARFREERPAEFQAYLLRDAEITARYAMRFAAFCADLGLRGVPSTLGSTAVAFLHQTLKEAGLDRQQLFGLKTETKFGYSKASGRQTRSTQSVQTFAAALIDRAAAIAYNGGRTETFVTGPVAADMLRDVDLRSAYPTAMASMGVLDYANIRVVRDEGVDLFTADSAGFAEIEFDSPASVRYPFFGVHTDRGLIFPRCGVAVATAPEIAAARRAGVSVTIRLGVIIPWNRSIRPHEMFVVRMTKLRESLKHDGKDTLESKTVKVITNSIYGKTAQGVREQSVTRSGKRETKRASRSSVTSPVLAAYTTGLVRAAIAELLNGIPPHYVTVSVSTDGFLTSAPVDEIDLSGPATQHLLEARRRIGQQTGAAPLSDHAELLEVKKQVIEVVAFRNRGIATTAYAEGSSPVLAKNGIKVAKGIDANRFVLGLYLDREYDTRVERRDLIPLRSQLEQNADLVSILRSLRVNFEPDMKRRLIGGVDVAIHHGEFAGRTHLSTQSEPFDTVEDAMLERAAFDEWRDGRNRVMKTESDWQDWLDYLASQNARARSGARIRVTSGGSTDVLKRQFLRALVRSIWGLSLGGRSHQAIADWLTASGYPTSLSAVKNATRKTLTAAEGCVAVTPASIALLRVLIARYPTLDIGRLFSTDDAEKARRQLADGEAA